MTNFKQALKQSNLDETARRLAYPSRALPNPLGFGESFQQYLVRCDLRAPFFDDKKRLQDPDCTCRGLREHHRHDHDCPVGIAYRNWDAFMRARWDDIRSHAEEEPSS